MKLTRIILLLSFVSILAASCHSGKKCNGQRGTRVEMGTMEANHGK